MSYYVDHVIEKRASAIGECQGIMQRIYKEDPSYWPHGLSVDQCDGGLYMIREASSGQAVGFTGWQERKEGMKKVGYYAIGILPEHRRNGFAKEAVAEIIKAKAASVDEVRAYIMPHNVASKSLANKLGVPVIEKMARIKDYMEKSAGLGPWAKGILGATAVGGVGTLAANNPEWVGDASKSIGSFIDSTPTGAPTLAMTALGTLLGARKVRVGLARPKFQVRPFLPVTMGVGTAGVEAASRLYRPIQSKPVAPGAAEQAQKAELQAAMDRSEQARNGTLPESTVPQNITTESKSSTPLWVAGGLLGAGGLGTYLMYRQAQEEEKEKKRKRELETMPMNQPQMEIA